MANLERDRASIIVIGKFNPAIFHPFWFRANGLIKPQEELSAKLEVTHPAISIFSVEAFRLQVQPDRFSIETGNEIYFDSIMDIVKGVFSLLEHTPISAMGVNRMMHFKMDSEEIWHSFGDKIAPKDIWRDVMDKAGLLSMTMKNPRDGKDQYVRVKVEPSGQVSPGIYIDVNNHFEIKDNNSQTMLKILKESGEKILEHSKEIAISLMEKNK